MAALGQIFLKKEKLVEMIELIDQKNAKGVSISLSISDEPSKYGENISAYIEQSQDERTAKEPKRYMGNGKIYWNNNIIKNGVKIESTTSTEPPPVENYEGSDDLPF